MDQGTTQEYHLAVSEADLKTATAAAVEETSTFIIDEGSTDNMAADGASHQQLVLQMDSGNFLVPLDESAAESMKVFELTSAGPLSSK